MPFSLDQCDPVYRDHFVGRARVARVGDVSEKSFTSALPMK